MGWQEWKKYLIELMVLKVPKIGEILHYFCVGIAQPAPEEEIAVRPV